MFHSRFQLAGVLFIGAAMLLSACGSNNNSTNAGSGGGGAYGGGNGGGGGSTPASSGSSAAIATSNVSGLGPVLVDSKGDVLYYDKSEKGGAIKCTGSCASLWPPVLLP